MKTYQEAYVWVRDKMECGKVMTWEDFGHCLESKGDKIENQILWDNFVSRRNLYKKNINRIARKEEHKQNWRLQIYEWGVSIVKNENKALVSNEIPARFKRISNHMDSAKIECGAMYDAMSELEELSTNDKKWLRASRDMLEGAMMTIRGAIGSLECIDEEVKDKLLAFFDAA